MVRRYYNKRSWLDQLQVWIGGIALRHVDHSGIGEASKTNRTSEALKTHPCCLGADKYVHKCDCLQIDSLT